MAHDAELIALHKALRADKKVDAIKALRNVFGHGLREAKDVIEVFAACTAIACDDSYHKGYRAAEECHANIVAALKEQHQKELAETYENGLRNGKKDRGDERYAEGYNKGMAHGQAYPNGYYGLTAEAALAKAKADGYAEGYDKGVSRTMDDEDIEDARYVVFYRHEDQVRWDRISYEQTLEAARVDAKDYLADGYVVELVRVVARSVVEKKLVDLD